MRRKKKVVKFPSPDQDIRLIREPLGRLNEAYDWIETKIGERSITDVEYHDLESITSYYGNHVAIFHRSGRETGIMRIYWPDKGMAMYHTIVNYQEMAKNSPELTRFLLRNGEYAYLSENDKEECLRVYGSY
jgi:hypothetical protein